MVGEVVQYCLTMFAALVASHTYGIANTVDGIIPGGFVIMTMMPVLIATNIRYLNTGSRLIGLDWFGHYNIFIPQCLCEFLIKISQLQSQHKSNINISQFLK